MGLPAVSHVGGAAGDAGYVPAQSIQFSAADTQYLTWTPESAGNRKKWTYSAWVKPQTLGGYAGYFGICAGGDAGSRSFFGFDNDAFYFFHWEGTVYRISVGLAGPRQFRDPTAWYHVVVALDTTQAAAADAVKVWINGEQQTINASNYIQNAEPFINNNQAQVIGYDVGLGSRNFDGLLSGICFIDGQQLDADNFGEFGADGVWRPKEIDFPDTLCVNAFDTNACSGGTPFTSQPTSLDPAQAFDGITTYGGALTAWQSSGNATDVQLGYEFATSKAIRRFGFFNGWSGDSNHSVTTVAVDYSDDGITWTEAVTCGGYVDDGGVSEQYVYIPYVGSHLYWAIRNVTAPVTAWTVNELRMCEATSTSAFGTNGFLIQDCTGADQSGNGNDFTPVNSPADSSDVPADDASANLGNFARLNPLQTESLITYSSAALSASYSGVSARAAARSTIKISAGVDFFCEVVATAALGGGVDLAIGIEDGTAVSGNTNAVHDNAFVYRESGDFIDQNSSAGYGAPFTDTDVIGVWRKSNGDLVFYKNGASQGTAKTGLTGEYFLIVCPYNGGSCTVRFDNLDWTDAPDGVNGAMSLCTAHLPAKLPVNPKAQIAVGTYTGNSPSSQAITGLEFRPDFLWIKSRQQAYSHFVYDSVRGAGATGLNTNTTDAEGTNDSVGLLSFDADGFTVSGDGSLNDPVSGTDGFVYTAIGGLTQKTSGWGAGTITPIEERYDATLGMSIIKYTGNGTAGATLPHSLGQAPAMVIIKNLSDGMDGWAVYHADVGADFALLLNQAYQKQPGAAVWNNTVPTSTLVTLGDETALDYVVGHDGSKNNSSGCYGPTFLQDGQAFAVPGPVSLYAVDIFLNKIGSPIDSRMKVYTCTGTPGSAAGRGSLLYTSDDVAPGDIPTGGAWVRYSFPAHPTLDGNYCFMLEHTGGDSSNWLMTRVDDSAGPGNWVDYDGVGNNAYDNNIKVFAGPGGVNVNGDDYIAYLFADTDAIKVGSYTGTGSADGPFVDLGGLPIWIIEKAVDDVREWNFYDIARDPHNVAYHRLSAQSSAAETTGVDVADFVSVGLKLRSTADSNRSGKTHIYLAFLDTYFGGSNVTQGKAR